MQRILILGCPGAGKSTLARQIGQSLQLPVIHLDREYWRAGWRPMPDAKFVETVAKLVERPCWVMDGNYHRTLDVRLACACRSGHSPRFCSMAVLVAHLPPHVDPLQFYALATGYGRGGPEQWDWEFIEWIWDFRNEIRPKTRAALERHAHQVRIITLRTPSEVAKFVETIQDHRTTVDISADQLNLVPT